VRSPEEHTAEITQVADIKILQKVNAAHREGFAVKYPGQIEHCLRLVMERLQLGLDKRNGVDPANPDTWRLSTQELSELVQCAYQLDSIRRGF
jgi:hypothetical protein